MPDYILVQSQNQRWERAGEKELPNEVMLQDLVRDNPEILPFDDLGDDTAPLLIVGRETALANGYADVIGVDENGLVTIIECKLDRNPEAKRKVIGQVLGYGAYVWGMTYEIFDSQVARAYFESAECPRPDLRGLALDEAMERFRGEQALGGEWSRETFREQLQANLAAGRFRLVIVVDRVNDELRRTVEYLNQCTSPEFQILCAELRYFQAGAVNLLVPALVGATGSPKPKPAAAVSKRKWDEAQFFAELQTRYDEATVAGVRAIFQWSRKMFDSIWWGEGAQNGSFVPTLVVGDKLEAKPFVVYTSGQVEIGFQWLKYYPPFDEADQRMELLKQLNQVEGIKLPTDAFSRRPSFRIEMLTQPATRAGFMRVMEEMVQKLKQARAA